MFIRVLSIVGLFVATFSAAPAGAAAPVRTVSIQDVSAPEGMFYADSSRITITLSKASRKPVTVTVGLFESSSTGDGTAITEWDFDPAPQTVVLPAGSQSGTVAAPIHNDSLAERDDTAFARIILVDGATVGDGESVVTIQNDDGALSTDIPIWIRDVGRIGEGQTAFFDVILDRPSAPGLGTSVGYRTEDAPFNRISSNDYEQKVGTLTFDSGEQRDVIAVSTSDDVECETYPGFGDYEAFFVRLFAPVNGVLAKAGAYAELDDYQQDCTG